MKDYLFVRHQNLQKYNSLRIEAFGNVVFPANTNAFYDIFDDYPLDQYTIFILGKGSNILFTQECYDDSYLFISTKLLDQIVLSKDYIIAEAGCTLSELAYFAAENKITGFSFLEDIPGTIGGGCSMNAGTYNNTISQNISYIEYYNISKRCIENITNNPSLFGKRFCQVTQSNNVILSCGFKMEVSEEQDVTLSEINNIFNIKYKRYAKQPRDYPSAGSVFIRPPLFNGHQYYVWELLEQTGLKGHSIGGAQISEKHPGFIINRSNGKPQDFLDLINLCKEKVYNQFGIELQLEWKLI